MNVYLADHQDITRAGLQYVLAGMGVKETKTIADKTELILALRSEEKAVVVLDYTLFDINDANELSILCERFQQTQWVLFSEDLSQDFIRSVSLTCPHCSFVLKECRMAEIKEALSFAFSGKRFICQQVMELLLQPEPKPETERPNLTKTEVEILKDIALGLTTREIAAKRFSSFHTINTHRKNIFRKLGVNNLKEATRYALRAGLVDEAEYYI